MIKYYDATRREYERKKTDFRFAVRYYKKNKELLSMQNATMNSDLKEILASLARIIHECEYLIKSIDVYCDSKMADSNLSGIINTSGIVIGRCTSLVRDTIKMIYNDDPMSLQGILRQTNNNLGLITCSSDNILAKINN